MGLPIPCWTCNRNQSSSSKGLVIRPICHLVLFATQSNLKLLLFPGPLFSWIKKEMSINYHQKENKGHFWIFWAEAKQCLLIIIKQSASSSEELTSVCRLGPAIIIPYHWSGWLLSYSTMWSLKGSAWHQLPSLKKFKVGGEKWVLAKSNHF